jgi:hypothetical protein
MNTKTSNHAIQTLEKLTAVKSGLSSITLLKSGNAAFDFPIPK